MQPDNQAQLVVALRRAADALVARRSIRDLEATLAQIVAAAVQSVPGADQGGISLTEGGQVSSRAPTSADIRKLDDLQAELDEGPCMTAVTEGTDDGVIHAPDLAEAPSADRWPNFAPRAVAQGYRSMLSTQLSTNGGTRAALNLYSHEPHAFDRDARTIAGLFGIQAAVLLYGTEHAEHLQQALSTRDVIGQAKGVLMERFDVDDDRAFQMLVKSSQDTNLKLLDVAHWLTVPASRRLSRPPAPTDPG